MIPSVMVNWRSRSAGWLPSVAWLNGPKRIRVSWMFWQLFLYK